MAFAGSWWLAEKGGYFLVMGRNQQSAPRFFRACPHSGPCARAVYAAAIPSISKYF